MFRQLVGAAIVMTCCLSVTLIEAAPRKGGGGGGGGGRSSGRSAGGGGGAGHVQGGRGGAEGMSQRAQAPRGRGQATQHGGGLGGAWSDFNAGGAHGANQMGGLHDAQGRQGFAAGRASGNFRGTQAAGGHDAAAGAAFSNRNAAEHSGAQGAAAGAGIANRNDPQYSGAQGAAAGAAVDNRNSPQYSGAQGAAAGAAIENRNSPQYSGAQGAAVGAAVENRNSPEFSGAQGAAAASLVGAGSPNYAAVRGNFNHPTVYGQGWYGAHPTAWTATGWAAGTAWTPTAWATIAGANGYDNASTVSYNYGNNVTCVDNNVVVAGQSVGTAEEFAQEASDLAALGATANVTDSEEWMPLGVFAMVRNEQQHPTLILQLAVNKDGILRGNYTDEVTDNTQTIQGAVDPQTQRAAWTVGDNQFCVMEAGLVNLTQDELPALIHKNGTTQRWLLVRMSQPASGAQSEPAAALPE